MSFVTKLVALVGDLGANPGDDALRHMSEERLAVAALLVHVARADGVFDEAERVRLVELLMERFGWPEGSARRLVERADGLDRQVDDIAELIDMTGHSLDGDGRRQLVAMAYDVAAADGRIAEFEDDLVWRLGHLLGIDEPELAAIRERTVGPGVRP